MSKMDCDIIRDLLPLYVDDVVSDAARQAVDDHLAGCPACQQELVRLQRTLRLPLVREAAPLRQLRRRWKQTKFRTALISILCTALLLGCLGWYFRPRPLAQAVPQDADSLSVTLIMSYPYHKEGTEGTYWDERVTDLNADLDSTAGQAMLAVLEALPVRGAILGHLGPITVYRSGASSFSLSFYTPDDRVDFTLLSDTRTLYVTSDGPRQVYTVGESAFDALAAIVEAYGVQRPED